MLLFRTLNQALRAPHHNDDFLAAKIRDELIPVRSWWLKNVPWAKYQLRSMVENSRWGVPGCTNFIDARTKWMDAAVKDGLAAGIKQVVLIAAGYDTRAYRLAPADGSVRFFEVDLPDASHRKRALAKKLKLCKDDAALPTYVAADLSVVDLGDALGPAGFNPAQPTLFTMEGLIYYLPPSAAQALMGRITQLSAPGSKVVFDFMHATALEGREKSPDGYKYAGFKITAKSVANKGEAYKFGLPDSAQGVSTFLAASAASMPSSRHTASPAGPEAAEAGRGGAGKALQLTEYMGPRQMVAQQLPHLAWNDEVPPIAAFYSYAQAAML
ncbi:S-adenosyl-L-methionine-dependent methyltransferase [Haematococcus lacustris]